MTERSTAGRTSLLHSRVTVQAGNCSVTMSSIFDTYKRTEAIIACRHKSDTIKTNGADGEGKVGVGWGGGYGPVTIIMIDKRNFFSDQTVEQRPDFLLKTKWHNYTLCRVDDLSINSLSEKSKRRPRMNGNVPSAPSKTSCLLRHQSRTACPGRRCWGRTATGSMAGSR